MIETIYAWPGAGRLIIQAAKNRDFPVLQYAVFVTAILVIVANLLVDLAYGLLDPH